MARGGHWTWLTSHTEFTGDNTRRPKLERVIARGREGYRRTMERSLRLVPIICYARNTRRFRDTRHPLSTPRLPACKVLDERLIRERNIPLFRNFPSLDNKDSRIFFRAFACARVRAIAQQNNSPTPVLGTAMISVFLRSAVFFFPKCKAGERAHGDVTRGAGAAFNCGVSFSSPGTSRYSARYSADQIALSPRYENTLRKFSQPPRSARDRPVVSTD